MILNCIKLLFIPVIASIATDERGDSHNVNADVAVAAIAAATPAEKLLFVSDIDGIMANKDKAETLIDRISAAEPRKMIESGEI